MQNNKEHYLIIAGVNKAGTTSLFSYLNQHPDLCGSSIKETCFFLPIRYNEPIEPLEKYKQLFSQCKNPKYFMESTPGYFYGGQALIDAIKTNLGNNVKIVLVFRDPVQRLISFFKFQKSRLNIEEKETLENYVKYCHSLDKQKVHLQDHNHYYGIEGGKYSDYIDPWLNSFKGNIKILFFEHIKENPKEVLQELSNWLDIDATAFDQIKVEVENKTRYVGNRFIHKAALIVNDSFEKFFRANPNIKKKLRNIYFYFNEKAAVEDTNEQLLAELSEFYKPFNQSLKNKLLANGVTKFPKWLNEE